MAKGQLHQLLAVLPTLKGQAEKITSETAKSFAAKQHLFQGMVKSFKAKMEEFIPLERELSETNPLSETVAGKLAHLSEHVAPHIDAEYQRDLSNMVATATVSFGKVKIEGVPATFLLQLKKELASLRSVYDVIPTLDPKRDWKIAPDLGAGVYLAPSEFTAKTKKETVHKVIVPATDHHPAQVAAYVEDIPIGQFETRHRSGMITPEQKYRIMKRIDELIAEVTRALAEANQVEHRTEKIAERILDYINNG